MKGIHAGPSVLIVGCGPSSHRFLQEFSKKLPTAKLRVLSDEKHLPYVRTALTKLTDSQICLSERELARELSLSHLTDSPQIEWLFNVRALECDTVSNSVRSSANYDLDYDYLVVSSGVRARESTCPSGLHVSLRSVKDARRLLDATTEVDIVRILGGGSLACELAVFMRRLGKDVSLHPRSREALMQRFVGSAVGDEIARYLSTIGVSIEPLDRCQMSRRLCDQNACGLCEQVNLCVDAIGDCANVEWLPEPIGDANGVLVNDYLQSPYRRNIFAIGDASTRVGLSGSASRSADRSWSHALASGRALAENLLAQEQGGVMVPFYSNFVPSSSVILKELRIQTFGYVADADCAAVMYGQVEDALAGVVLAYYRCGVICGLTYVGVRNLGFEAFARATSTLRAEILSNIQRIRSGALSDVR